MTPTRRVHRKPAALAVFVRLSRVTWTLVETRAEVDVQFKTDFSWSQAFVDHSRGSNQHHWSSLCSRVLSFHTARELLLSGLTNGGLAATHRSVTVVHTDSLKSKVKGYLHPTWEC